MFLCLQISQKIKEEIARDVLQKAVDGLHEEDCQFVGVLFAGLMLTSSGPRVLEFNCRFGDPGEVKLLLRVLVLSVLCQVRPCCEKSLNGYVPVL